jgi:hypothetical protein
MRPCCLSDGTGSDQNRLLWFALTPASPPRYCPPPLDHSPTDPQSAGTPRRRFGTSRTLLWLLVAIAVACVVYLIFGPSPRNPKLDTSAEAKESLRTHSWVVKGMWFGAAINLVLSLLAILAWRFRPSMIDDTPLAPVGAPTDGRFSLILRWCLIAAATVTAAWAMAPRLDHSLWGDEEATARRFVIGHVYRDQDGSGFTLKPPTWQKTIWNWDTGTNNHILFSVLARLSHGAADLSGEKPDRFYFSERRIRLPSFLATLAMIPAAAWVVTLLGFPRGGPVTAFLLALHPWVVRFGADARGYALLMLLGTLAIACLIGALRHPARLRWWLAFGLCEWLLLCTHLTSIYLLAPLNLAALWLAWRPNFKERRNPFAVANVWRWAGANLLGAMLTIQSLMPIALQMPGYLARGRLNGEITSRLLGDSLAYWTLGTPWHPWEPGNPLAVNLSALWERNQLGVVLPVAWLAAFFIGGVFALAFRSGPRHRWLLLPLLAPIPLMFLDAWRSDHLLYPWYSAGYLPMLFIVAGAGFSHLVPDPIKFKGVLSTVWGVSLIGAFALATEPQRKIIRHQPVEPLADTVRLTRGAIVNPFHPRIDDTLTLGFVHATRLYDPAMTHAENDQQFVEAIHDAETKNRPLWVNAANLGIATNFPVATALIADREVFEEPVVIYGLQDPCTRSVFRYKPGGLAKFEARQQKEAR